MDRNTLIETAAAIPPPSQESIAAYAGAIDRMVAEVNRRMDAREDIERLVGTGNLAMMQNNHANHARFVHTILAHPDPTALVDTVLWVFRAYRSHGFSLAYWPALLDEWTDVMRELLEPGHYDAIYPLYAWFIVRQPAFVEISESQLAQAQR